MLKCWGLSGLLFERRVDPTGGIDDLNVPAAVPDKLSGFFESGGEGQPLEMDHARRVETVDFKHAVPSRFWEKRTRFWRVVSGFLGGCWNGCGCQSLGTVRRLSALSPRSLSAPPRQRTRSVRPQTQRD